MLIDYLRYQAFSGRLRNFFERGFIEFVDPSHSSGQHLRFAPDWPARYHASYLHNLRMQILKGDYSDRSYVEDLLYHFDIFRKSESFRELAIGTQPSTCSYDTDRPLRLEIVIDILPQHWSERYQEARSYEDDSVIYRRCGPARADLGSGSRLVDRHDRRSGFGTLCGTFHRANGSAFGLTCGHVTRQRGKVILVEPRSSWLFWLKQREIILGTTEHFTTCSRYDDVGQVLTQLDAALVNCAEHSETRQLEGGRREGVLKPISSIIQEEPVQFIGASRRTLTRAKVAAVTVRKSIDLWKDGTLHSIGDVLMLDHRERMYVVQPVCRPGDSGSAVHSTSSKTATSDDQARWYGMIVGGDEHSAYASYAETLWGWAADTLSDRFLNFYL